jgi:hypothetical protein
MPAPEVRGGKRKLHNEKLQSMYSSPYTIRPDGRKENEIRGTYSTCEKYKKCI